MNKHIVILALLMSVINMGLQAYTPAQVVRNYKPADASTLVQPSTTTPPSTTAVQQAETQVPPSTTASSVQSAASQVPTSTAAAQEQATTAAQQQIASQRKGSFGFFF